MKTFRMNLLLVASMLCFQNLSAQDSLSVIGKYIHGHPWTMEFGITSNLTLTSFQGTTISLSKFTSDFEKYRFGISFSGTDGSSDQNSANYAMDTLSSRGGQNSDNVNYALQISFQYVTYATPNAPTSFYFGIGPLIGYGWTKNQSRSTTSNLSGSQSFSNSTSETNNYSLGFLGSLGVEWFFSEHLSVHAEYGLAATYTWGKTESTSVSQYMYTYSPGYSNRSNSSTTTTNWSLSGQKVLFGLSVNY